MLLDLRTNRIYTPNTNQFQDLGAVISGDKISAVGADERAFIQDPKTGKMMGRTSEKSIDKTAKSDIMGVTNDSIVIPDEKFTKYALDPDVVPDKARMFKSYLGFTKDTANILSERIRENFNADLLVEKLDNGYGKRYEAIIRIKGINGKFANVTTGWIDDKSKNEFRMTTAYIDKRRQ